MKASASLLASFILLASTVSAAPNPVAADTGVDVAPSPQVCCYYATHCGKKRDLAPIPMLERSYAVEDYVPEGATNVAKREELKRSAQVCCCDTADPDGCPKYCG